MSPTKYQSRTSRGAPTGHKQSKFNLTSLQPRRWAHIKRSTDMNTIRTLYWALFFVVGILHAEPSPNLPGGNSISTFMKEIPGTTLMENGCYLRDATGAWQQFSVGYLRLKGGNEATFVPILSLPDLVDDEYTVRVDSGVLRIGTKKTKKKVLALHLIDICPAVITTEVEQAGAAQPATKPADRPPVKDQPSTPTSKDGPR